MYNDIDNDIVCQNEKRVNAVNRLNINVAWFWMRCASAAVVSVAMVACSGPRSEPARSQAAGKYAISLLSQSRFQEPPGWSWGTFINADNARLRYGWAEPKADRKGLIVLLPGYQATAEAFFETCHDLLSAGYAVWVLDRRGQGGSDRWLDNPQKNYSLGLEHDEHDVEQFIKEVVQGVRNEPRFLVGESLGGHIGFRVLHDYPSYFQAAAFSSPSIAFHTGQFPEGLARMLTRFEVNHGSGTAYAIGEHDWQFDPEAGNPKDPVRDDRDRALMAQAWLLKDPKLRSGGSTNAYVAELFRSSALEQSSGWMEAVRTPILIGQVPNDKIANAEVMSDACHRLPACKLISFQGAGHALFSDSDNARLRWMKALCSFFDTYRGS